MSLKIVVGTDATLQETQKDGNAFVAWARENSDFSRDSRYALLVSAGNIIVVGGGAAGFFGAIACAEASPGTRVTLLEKGPQFLSKVRISGGGRCNVTHACFDPREFATRYPRGDRALISVLQRFSAADTVAWFEQRGVKLKAEADGRMFPITDS